MWSRLTESQLSVQALDNEMMESDSPSLSPAAAPGSFSLSVLPSTLSSSNSAQPPLLKLNLEDFILDDATDLSSWNSILNSQLEQGLWTEHGGLGLEHGVSEYGRVRLPPYRPHLPPFVASAAATGEMVMTYTDGCENVSEGESLAAAVVPVAKVARMPPERKKKIEKLSGPLEKNSFSLTNDAGSAAAAADIGDASVDESFAKTGICYDSSTNKAVMNGVKLDIVSNFFGCYWRNGNQSILAFPHARNLPDTDYITLLDNPDLGYNSRTTSDAVRIRVTLPPGMDRSTVFFVAHICEVASMRSARDVVGIKSTNEAVLEASNLGPPVAIAHMPPIDGEDRRNKAGTSSAAAAAAGDKAQVIEMKPMRHFAWKYTASVGSQRQKLDFTKRPIQSIAEAHNHKYSLTFCVRAYTNNKSVRPKLKGRRSRAGSGTSNAKCDESTCVCIGAVQSPAFFIGSTRNLKLRGTLKPTAPAIKEKRPAPNNTTNLYAAGNSSAVSGNAKRLKKSTAMPRKHGGDKASRPIGSDGATDRVVNGTASSSIGTRSLVGESQTNGMAMPISREENHIFEPEANLAISFVSANPAAVQLSDDNKLEWSNVGEHRDVGIVRSGYLTQASLRDHDVPEIFSTGKSDGCHGDEELIGGSGKETNALTTPNSSGLALAAKESSNSRSLTGKCSKGSASMIDAGEAVGSGGSNGLDPERGHLHCKLAELEVGDFELGAFEPYKLAHVGKNKKCLRAHQKLIAGLRDNLWTQVRKLFKPQKRC